MRADLQQHVDACVQGVLDGGGEPDRLADVAPPVLGVQAGRGYRPAGDRGDQSIGVPPRGQPVETGRQRGTDPLHDRAVEGVVEVHEPEEHLPHRQLVAQ